MSGKRWHVGGRFYAIAAVLALVLVGVIWVMATRQESVVSIETGVVADSAATEALILRSEQVIPSENYGKVIFYTAEGETVAQGDKIALVYKEGYSEKQLQSLETLNKQILEKQLELIGDVVNADLNGYNSQIQELSTQVATAVDTDTNLVLLQRQLNEVLAQRSTYLREHVNADTELETLYTQLDELNTNLDSWRTELVSPSNGITSFYLDGYERQLTLDDIGDYKLEDAWKLMQETEPDENLDSRIYKSLYRLVNQDQWFLAITGTDQTFVNDASYEIALSDVTDTVYKGQVVLDLGEKDKRIVLLVVNEPIGSLLNLRKVEATVGKTYEGLRISIRALRKVDGVWQVRLDDTARTMVPVNVVIQNEEYAIITEVGNDQLLMEGTRLVAR